MIRPAWGLALVVFMLFAAFPAFSFNNDGKPDILWRHTDNNDAVWYMNGGYRIGTNALIAITDPHWRMIGAGDFNNDSQLDIRGCPFVKDKRIVLYAPAGPRYLTWGWNFGDNLEEQLHPTVPFFSVQRTPDSPVQSRSLAQTSGAVRTRPRARYAEKAFESKSPRIDGLALPPCPGSTGSTGIQIRIFREAYTVCHIEF